MRPKKVTIPSGVIKLDTQITQPDEVVNAHDLHVFRQNHNALLAKRARKDLWSQAFTRSGGTPTGNYIELFSRGNIDETAACRMISVPLYMTQLTQELHVWCRACKTAMDASSTLAEDPKLYAVLREPHVAPMVNDLTANVMTVTAAAGAPAAYSVDIVVPNRSGEHSLQYGRQVWILDIYLRSHIDDTYALHTAAAKTDVGRTWFSSSVPGSGHSYNAVTSGSDVEPRMITREISIGGGVYKYFLDDPWSVVPSGGITIREILGIRLYEAGAYESAITDFNTEGAI